MKVKKLCKTNFGNAPQALHVLSRGVVARKVIIPPYSVLIGRGDLQHAGAGHEDNPNPSVRGSIRYHIYFVPHTQKLMDGVHYPTDLNPDFEEDESEESEGAGGMMVISREVLLSRKRKIGPSPGTKRSPMRKNPRRREANG